LARYIIRASFSQERMTYISAHDSSSGNARVLYESKVGKIQKNFEALDWLALLTTHIPNKREQMVRYLGYYSNKSRGQRKKAGKDDDAPALIESDISKKLFRKNWARLIQKIYHVNPLICTKCQGEMRIIAFIESPVVIQKILTYLKLWETRNHDPPAVNATHIPKITYDATYSQIPVVDYWTQ
jgi:hypothetical protein